MASDIFGTIYEDVNRSGDYNTGENGVGTGWTVFLDLNKDAAISSGEPTATTDTDGAYVFKGVAPGNYRVAEDLPDGWLATSPISLDVTHTDKGDTQVDFFAFAGGTIKGTAWNDLNDNGIRDIDPATGEFTDPGLSGWSIFLDLNKDRAFDAGEPVTTTAADGTYVFREIPSGEYEVTEELPAGWDSAKKNDWKQTVFVAPLKESIQDFGNIGSSAGGMQGTLFNDLNADGFRNVDATTGEFTEPGLENWTVFIDLNNNLTLDDGELSAITDKDGEYQFRSLDPGDYEVVEILPTGWEPSPGTDSQQTITVFNGEVTTAPDFANFTTLNGSISGVVWNDINRNGIRDYDTIAGAFVDPPLVGWTVFVDLNRNKVADPGEPMEVTDTNGQYLFTDLQVGEYEVQEFLPPGWEVAPTFSDNQSVIVFSGVDSPAMDFANFDASASSPGSVAGVVWNDENGNGLRDTLEHGLGSWTVFLDVNSDGILNSGESTVTTPSDGSYAFSSVSAGTVSIGVLPVTGWRGTVPLTNSRTITLKGGESRTGLDFGEIQLKDASISGSVFADRNKNGTRELGEKGLSGLLVYLDLNNNSLLDLGEPSTATSQDEFYTPTLDEAGQYSFTHLALGSYTVRVVVPETLNATPASELAHTVVLAAFEARKDINSAAIYRASEIHGTKFEDVNGNHLRDDGEPAIPGAAVFLDINRNNSLEPGEPTTLTGSDGSYVFTNLEAGSYVVRSEVEPGYVHSSPTTVGGILWPDGTSNPAVGNVSPTSITKSLIKGENYRLNVSLTLPDSGALTDLVDVFLLFDDTGSFVNNSPIVRAAFPDIISSLQTQLPGIDLGFGVGRLEEYANFAYEYDSGRPFTLNQPVVAASTAGYMSAIQAALDRTAPGYGGDQPETDIEALYQLVTGKGFDGNNNGTVSDSGPAGLASTQLNPGASGDVPAFSSFTPDPANNVMPAAGNVGGAGFRPGALPIILLATDTGFAYQPKGETTIVGAGGVSIDVSQMTQTSRASTPYNSGAGIQETITGLNALGALVIGLGTNPQATIDPRQQLEAISKLTGAINQSTFTIENGTADKIIPGDPLYFQIASGFGASVANGVVNAITNAVTNVAVDLELRASDPRVKIINHTGIVHGIGAAQTATFDVEFIGDGIPRRFDLQFVRAGSNVVMGSIPIVLGTLIPGDGYHFDELEDGEIEIGDDYSDRLAGSTPPNTAPSFVIGSDALVLEDSGLANYPDWATAISAGAPSESSQSLNFIATNDNSALFSIQPSVLPNGTLTFKSADNAFGSAVVSLALHDNGGTANGGSDTSLPQTFTITVDPVNDAPVASDDQFTTHANNTLTIGLPGVLGNDSDSDSSSITVRLVSLPSHGSLLLNPDGSFVYDPDAGYTGSDSFRYVANDGSLDSNEAEVRIDVSNLAPTGVNDAFELDEGQLLSVAAPGVLTNDSDLEGDSLLVSLVVSPSHGTLTFHSDGSFEYLPDANFNGSDSFTYKISDGLLDSNETTVSLTVRAVNDPPTAGNDSYSTLSGTPLTIPAPGVLFNDTDIDSTILSSIVDTLPSYGTLVLNSDGSFVYTPALGFAGLDQFSYHADDGLSNSNPATVVISVINQAPTAVDDAYSISEDQPLILSAPGILGNDTDPEGDALSAILVKAPTHGTLTIQSDGSFSYLPDHNFNGSDTFTYRVTDSKLDSNVATVFISVTPVNDAPVANDDRYTATSGKSLLVTAPGVLLNDSDIDSPTLHSVLVSSPSHGSVTFNTDGSFSYTSYPGFAGVDQFTYVADDGTDQSAPATAIIDVVSTTKDVEYLVVDQSARKRFDYDTNGNLTGQTSLDRENKKARGITTSEDGSTSWVIDADGVVYVYDRVGKSLGSWEAKEVDKPEGIGTDGVNLWIVDNSSDCVLYFADAALARSGKRTPSGSFPLVRDNRNPTDLTTDGSSIWVTNDTAKLDKVFRYSIDGTLQGSWQIDAGNARPTGIAVDPNDLTTVWIADSRSDRVYQYDNAAGVLTGAISASHSFSLTKRDSNAQGLSVRRSTSEAKLGFASTFDSH